MKTLKSLIGRMSLAALVISVSAVSFSQNVVVAKFASSPSEGQSFGVNLINSGTEGAIAGFAFKLTYDPSQVSISGVKDNTGQSASKIQYTLGKEIAAADGMAERVLTATTAKDLVNAANLAEVKFEKKAGFATPFRFKIEDRITTPVVDGLQSGVSGNVPHTFDSSAVTQ